MGLSCAIIILALIFKTANQWCPHLLQWGVIDVLWIITAGSSQGLQDHIFLQRWKKILKGTKGPKKTSKERNEAKQTWPVYSRTELTQPHKRLLCFIIIAFLLSYGVFEWKFDPRHVHEKSPKCATHLTNQNTRFERVGVVRKQPPLLSKSKSLLLQILLKLASICSLSPGNQTE